MSMKLNINIKQPKREQVTGVSSDMSQPFLPRVARLTRMLLSRAVHGVAIALLLISASVSAAEVPNFDKSISMAAREQSVPDFFAELFSHLGLPVQVDPSIAGSVNGDFKGTAREIYSDIEKAFQLTMYFDSSKVYIYSSNQLSRKILPMSEKLGKMVLRNAKQLSAGDAMNKAVWSDMGLVVSGTERYRNQIESYTRAIRNRTSTPNKVASAPVPDEIIKVFKLKYAWADDTTVVSGGQELLVRGVATLLRTVVETGMVGVENNLGSQRSRLPRTEQGLRGQGLQSVGRIGADQTQPPITDSNERLRADGSTQAPARIVSSNNMGSTRIVADPLNNAVIIRDRSDRMQNYQDLINVLDVEPKMVEIEATIIDMDTDRLRSLGIDWRVQTDGADIVFGSAAASDSLLQSSLSSITDGLTGFTQNVLNDKTQFLSRIRALEQQKAARIVSKPHVMTLANVEALLDTTSTFFIRVAGREEVDLFNVSVGTTMRVTPHVFEQGGRSQIKLKIDIVDGNQASQQVDGIPVIDESTINTQAIINAGQSLLIGGLVREFKSTGVTKVPVLGNIPGLGALFRNTSKNTSRVERMFLISPRLSTQVQTGKRYSVPIMSGTEAQIIESGPSRLEPTLAGLASRDNAFPLEQALPTGNASVGLTVPNQPLPNADGYPQPIFETSAAQLTAQNETGVATLRDRMRQQNPELRPEVRPLPAPESESMLPETVTVTAPAPKQAEPAWQEVRVVAPKVPQPTVVREAQPTKPQFSTVPSDVDVVAQPSISLDRNDDWKALPPNTVQKAVTRPVAQWSKTLADDSNWTEIK